MNRMAVSYTSGCDYFEVNEVEHGYYMLFECESSDDARTKATELAVAFENICPTTLTCTL